MTTATEHPNSVIRSHNETPSATWSSAGRAYDEISRGILDAIEHCINRLAPAAGERLLDVATGTGWTARRLAERGFHVTGVDFAPDMLSTAQEIAAVRNLDIPFDLGDAEALPYRDASFDAVISTFGVMFVQRPEDAAAELSRVCRPGGRLALATWTPDGNVFEMFKIMKGYMPAPTGSPPPSPFEWGKPERLEELLGEAFELRFERGTSFYREPDGQAAWETFLNGYGPLHTLSGKLEAGQLEALKRDWIAFHDGFATELGICVPRDYWVVVGTRR
ncbi:class I SAM-dependent methyltransferase [Fodinicurvata halophila]|uniref:Class I SAM-dependent methyltransferase n=1 Tax=Fodinicurvata halophila TaxID=1419723 RepID=A0ABV8US27_9PROT